MTIHNSHDAYPYTIHILTPNVSPRPPKQLSPECYDLLNRIFVVDHAQRITVDEIRQHPWFVKPLSPKFQAAWDALNQKQEDVEHWLRLHTMDRVCFLWGNGSRHTYPPTSVPVFCLPPPTPGKVAYA